MNPRPQDMVLKLEAKRCKVVEEEEEGAGAARQALNGRLPLHFA